jgi:hypothetical protein
LAKSRLADPYPYAKTPEKLPDGRIDGDHFPFQFYWSNVGFDGARLGGARGDYRFEG